MGGGGGQMGTAKGIWALGLGREGEVWEEIIIRLDRRRNLAL